MRLNLLMPNKTYIYIADVLVRQPTYSVNHLQYANLESYDLDYCVQVRR